MAEQRKMASVPLPEGVENEAQLRKLLDTFVKQRITSKKRDEAVNTARKTLIQNHREEYDKLVAANMPKS